MSKISHSILIEFDSTEPNQTPIAGTMKISTAVDCFNLYKSKLEISYTRSKRQSIKDAFNTTRYTKLKEIWLIYFSVFGRMPNVSSVILTSDGYPKKVNQSELDLPISSQSLISDTFLSTGIATKILNSDQREPILISLSYLIASKQEELDPMNRFRFLWSAFNPLYMSFNTKGTEWEKARFLVCKLDSRGMLKEASSIFNHAPGPNSYLWRLGKWFSSFKPLSINKNKSEFKYINSVRLVTGDADINTLKEITNRYTYKACSQIPNDKNPISSKIESKSSGEGSFFRFVMRDYLYWLRCDTMHGNSIYPIFINSEQRQFMEVLNSSLEKIVIESVQLCASL